MKKNIKSYDESIHTTGRIWMMFAIIITQSVPLAISIYFNSWPSFKMLMAGLIPIIITFWPIAIVEVLTYSPMLGNGGTYLGFVTGNLSNLKVPCAVAAMEQAGAEPNTKEGEIISTLAIGASSLMTNLVLLLGVIFFSTLMPILQSPALKPAFSNLLPALFGALGIVFVSKNWKLAVAPVSLMVILSILMPTLQAGVLIPVGAVVSISVARIMYKKNLI